MKAYQELSRKADCVLKNSKKPQQPHIHLTDTKEYIVDSATKTLLYAI